MNKFEVIVAVIMGITVIILNITYIYLNLLRLREEEKCATEEEESAAQEESEGEGVTIPDVSEEDSEDIKSCSVSIRLYEIEESHDK